MQPLIMSMIFKKFLPRILGVMLLAFAGIFAAIWFLEGWTVFFTLLGVILLSIILVPVLIILDLVKMFGAGKELKEFLFRKRTKQELMAVIMQKGMSYFMQEQMSSIFGASEDKKSKKEKKSNVTDVKIKSDKNEPNEGLVPKELGAVTLGGTAVAALRSNNSEIEGDILLNEEDPMVAMMQIMNNPEVQAQMATMMQMMMTGDEGVETELDLSLLMNMTTIEEVESTEEKSKNVEDIEDIEDVEVKK